MINNIIDQIKKSEKQAKEIIASSKKESAAIIEKAYQQANKKVKDAEIKIKNLSLEAEAQAVEDSKVEKVKLEEQYLEKKKKLLKAFSAREEKAVSMLVSRVLD
jgi:vacuolar-type H+-ATPase subunit H